MQCVFPSSLPRAAGRHGQPRTVVGSEKLRRHQEDAVAQSLERGGMKLLGQTQSLEPVHQIVGQQQQMKIGLVGKEVACRNLAQGVVSLQFPDDPFDPCPTVVEAPEVEGLQIEIRNQYLVVVLAELEQRKLFVWLFWLGSSDDHKTVGMRPASGLISKLGCLHTQTDMGVMEVGQLAFDGPGELGHNDKVSLSFLQPLDGLVVVKPFVGADDHVSYSRRDLGKAGLEEVQHTTRSMNVSGAQLPMPEVLCLSFETKQRMIRWPSMLDGVVANPCLFLFAIHNEDCRVQVEDQARGEMGLDSHLRQESIVEPAQSRQGLGCQAQQESSEGAGIGVSGQSAQVSKDTIGLQQIGGLDSFEAKNYGIKDREQQLADGVAVVLLDQSNVHRNGILETNLSQETMKQIGTTIMCEGLVPKRDGKFSRSFWHYSEPYLLSSFH